MFPILFFKEPLPPLPWEGTLIANLSRACPQITKKIINQNEDCLYLNIFVPVADPSKIRTKLPVLFDIHGGAFMFGHSRSYSGPDYVMDRNVILVTINYRVGPLGKFINFLIVSSTTIFVMFRISKHWR